MQMSAVARVESGQSTAERYEALIRIANSIRSRKEPDELFAILTQELSRVIQFDGIAQFDEESNKINWHLGAGCRQHRKGSSESDREDTVAAWVFRHQEAVTLGTLEGETRFPASTEMMRAAGLQSVCALPLTTAHRRLGSLVIASV